MQKYCTKVLSISTVHQSLPEVFLPIFGWRDKIVKSEWAARHSVTAGEGGRQLEVGKLAKWLKIMKAYSPSIKYK